MSVTNAFYLQLPFLVRFSGPRVTVLTLLGEEDLGFGFDDEEGIVG
jgi:hypothetical protein